MSFYKDGFYFQAHPMPAKTLQATKHFAGRVLIYMQLNQAGQFCSAISPALGKQRKTATALPAATL
ncbi:hypothetical protein [Silvimonas sp.]|uniref:hypothetical protein n=1 Tax=Silvimonas sp. TaxID=2650811 RepID=UPI0028467AAE|nr:hypothetical protein [Silvimonas sp.]MDR3426958.1 hypothetical protein [Silvimonas sp.]